MASAEYLARLQEATVRATGYLRDLMDLAAYSLIAICLLEEEKNESAPRLSS